MPYRDDQAALEARRDELRRELADATRHAEALADAQREKERLAGELAALEARLERARSRRLPLLETVRVASPCSARWDDMTGDDRVRFCGSCQKSVYNLSRMESAEAEALLAKHSGAICVRLYQRADGTVMTADCPVGVRRRRVKRAALAVAGAGALAAGAASLFFARMGKPVAVMGEMTPLPTASAWAMGTVGPPAVEPPKAEAPKVEVTAPPAAQPAPRPRSVTARGPGVPGGAGTTGPAPRSLYKVDF